MIDNEIEKISINRKDIFIFEHHHYALKPWSIVKNKLEEEIALLSFDHHTDTHDPFLSCSYYKYRGEIDYKKMKALVDDIDYHDAESIDRAICKLRNDEHILTALQSGILTKAFIISPSGAEKPQSYEEKERIDNCNSDEAIMQKIMGTYKITPKDKRTYPPSDIYMPDFEFDDSENESDVLSDSFLKRHLTELSRISGLIDEDGTMKMKYILDIDLDYFHVPEASEPKEDKLIRMLIKNAEIITIAKESDCVSMCSEYRCNSKDLLEKTICLIQKAML